MDIMGGVWRIFVHLFGLDTCPVPPTQAASKAKEKKETKEDRDRRKRMHRVLRHG